MLSIAPTSYEAGPAIMKTNVTLVVDRDEKRGLDLALKLAYTDTVLPTRRRADSFASTGSEDSAWEAVHVPEASVQQHQSVAVVCPMDCDVSAWRDRPHLTFAEVDEDFDDPDDEAEVLLNVICGIKSDILILYNLTRFHDCIYKLQKTSAFTDVLLVTAYPTYRPGFNTIVASPTPNKFTWSSIYQTMVDAAGTDEEQFSITHSGFNKVAESLREGDVLLCHYSGGSTGAEPAWTVTVQQIASH